MYVYIKIKAMSSRRPIIDRTAFEITESKSMTDTKSPVEYSMTDAEPPLGCNRTDAEPPLGCNIMDTKSPVGCSIRDAKSLIEYIVRKNVKEYNDKLIGVQILPYLTCEEMENSAVTGKIGFGERRNENSQNPDAAVKNALTCFDDGIFRLFINDEEYKIDDAIALKEGDEITFIRLAMLSGRRW